MKDVDFLTWIHARLNIVHGENPNAAYMRKLQAIIKTNLAEQVSANVEPGNTTLRGVVAMTKHRGLQDSVLELLWRKFSEVQHSTHLTPNDPYTKARFLKWLETGNDDDAWS